MYMIMEESTALHDQHTKYDDNDDSSIVRVSFSTTDIINSFENDEEKEQQSTRQPHDTRCFTITSSKNKRSMRHFSTYVALGLLLVLALLTVTSSYFPNHFNNNTPLPTMESSSSNRDDETTITNSRRQLHRGMKMDYSEYSCDHLNLYTSGGITSKDYHTTTTTSGEDSTSDETPKYHKPHTNRHKQCAYAQTCNDGDGIYAPVVYCNEKFSTRTWKWILTPFVVVWLIVLFRMVGSTAEDFFSPSLEMMSLNLGLPPRFAGVTLLALGNGAPDIASTVNAILGDVRRGYLMGLGELAGAGMFISTIITGIVILYHRDQEEESKNNIPVTSSKHKSSKDVPCKGALVRDVIMFMITLVAVYVEFNSGHITNHTIRVMLGLYITYVLVVLVADIYHRTIVVPRRKRLRLEREAALCDCGAIVESKDKDIIDDSTHEQYFSARMVITDSGEEEEEETIGPSSDKKKKLTSPLLSVGADEEKQTAATETTSLLGPTSSASLSNTKRPCVITRKHSSTCSSKKATTYYSANSMDEEEPGGGSSTSVGPPKRSASGAMEYAIEALSNYGTPENDNNNNGQGWGSVTHHHHHHQRETTAVASAAAAASSTEEILHEEEEASSSSSSSEEEMLVVYHTHYHGGVQKLPLKPSKTKRQRSTSTSQDIEHEANNNDDDEENARLPYKTQSSGLLTSMLPSGKGASNPQVDVEDAEDATPNNNLPPLSELRARSQEEQIATSNYYIGSSDIEQQQPQPTSSLTCNRRRKWFRPLKEFIKLPCWNIQFQELSNYLNDQIVISIYRNHDISLLEKIVLTLELPFILLRMFTIPIPCNGYYCRPLVGLSTMLSPLWIIFYLYQQFNINLLTQVSDFMNDMTTSTSSNDSNSDYYYNTSSMINNVTSSAVVVADDDDDDSSSVVQMVSKSALYDQHRAQTDNEAYVRHIATVVVLCIPIVAGLFVIMLAPPSRYAAAASTSSSSARQSTSAKVVVQSPATLPCAMTIPLGLYGFAIAATWIDAVADQLVDVLSFLGIVAHVPGPLMGLTVLAVGNSFGDLAANVTMARKGLSNMAITACFAGPVFNMLVGVALGFSLLGHSLNNSSSTSSSSSGGSIYIPVHLTNPLRAAFLFSFVNCLLLLTSGMLLKPKGTIGRGYGYAALALYVIYTAISLAV